MTTHCTAQQLTLQGFDGGRGERQRRVEAGFDGGRISSDCGLLLFRELLERTSIAERFASCFIDHRNPDLIDHTVEELVRQRVLGLVQGYEDLNDHESLRDDVVLALACGKDDLTGEHRRMKKDRGHALAGKSTLNRLELTPADAGPGSRYKKIVFKEELIEDFFVDVFLDAYDEPLKRIVLDFDATDDPLHGQQEGRFFHGYYRSYCYLPLYVFCGHFLLVAKLRPSNIDGSAGTVDVLKRIIPRIRERWPKVKIIVRGDSSFCRDAIMSWCEANQLDYVFGIAKNSRLISKIAAQLERGRRRHLSKGVETRRFRDFRYRTLDSWSRSRRVVGKAEHLAKGTNPRFVVTSLDKSMYGMRELYEDLYCARGDMENRIKEQQLDLFADRTSTSLMRSNQLRLWFSSLAYVLVNEFRRVGLEGTRLEKAQVGTIRHRLLKVGGVTTLSVRRIYVALSSVFPLKDVFAAALANIQRAWPTALAAAG